MAAMAVRPPVANMLRRAGAGPRNSNLPSLPTRMASMNKGAGMASGAGYTSGVDPSVTGGIDLGGAAVNGRLTAGFLGVMVIGVGAFYYVTRRMQL